MLSAGAEPEGKISPQGAGRGGKEAGNSKVGRGTGKLGKRVGGGTSREMGEGRACGTDLVLLVAVWYGLGRSDPPRGKHGQRGRAVGGAAAICRRGDNDNGRRQQQLLRGGAGDNQPRSWKERKVVPQAHDVCT